MHRKLPISDGRAGVFSCAAITGLTSANIIGGIPVSRALKYADVWSLF
jgi:hypothetical protein